MEDNTLNHAGVKGMKWGHRKYQNKDGSLTPLGRKRYADKAKTEHDESDNIDSDAGYNSKTTQNRGKNFVKLALAGAVAGVAIAGITKATRAKKNTASSTALATKNGEDFIEHVLNGGHGGRSSSSWRDRRSGRKAAKTVVKSWGMPTKRDRVKQTVNEWLKRRRKRGSVNSKALVVLNQ